MSEITFEYHEGSWLAWGTMFAILVAIAAGLIGLAWILWRRRP